MHVQSIHSSGLHRGHQKFVPQTVWGGKVTLMINLLYGVMILCIHIKCYLGDNTEFLIHTPRGIQ